MIEKPENVSRAMKLIFIAKHLERVADDATNIGETVLVRIRGREMHRKAYQRVNSTASRAGALAA
jgi:phosphate transport system protein